MGVGCSPARCLGDEFRSALTAAGLTDIHIRETHDPREASSATRPQAGGGRANAVLHAALAAERRGELAAQPTSS